MHELWVRGVKMQLALAGKRLLARHGTLEVTEPSFCAAAAGVGGDASGRPQILARMIRCKLAEVEQTVGCHGRSMDRRRSFALPEVPRRTQEMVPGMVAVAADHDKTQMGCGKEVDSEAHGWAEAAAVAHGLEGNGIAEDMKVEAEDMKVEAEEVEVDA